MVERPVHVPKGEERAVSVTEGVLASKKRAGTMDGVRMCGQIDGCITATDVMEEVSPLPDYRDLYSNSAHRRLCSCSYFGSIKERIGGDYGYYCGRMAFFKAQSSKPPIPCQACRSDPSWTSFPLYINL